MPTTTTTLSSSLLTAGLRLALAFALSLANAAPVRADWIYRGWDTPTPTYTGEFGLRFWYGRTNTAKNLYDTSGALLISRLTYGDLSIFAAEGYARFEIDRRWFLKGYGGGGGFRKGSLKDEDFPPVIDPFSATYSVQQDSSLFYGAFDGGFNMVWGPDFRVGAFAGLHYLNQRLVAFGCTQAAFNPMICGLNPIPNPVKVITQDNNWRSLRLGIDAAFDFDRFRFSIDAAWVPYVWLSGTDTHWLRIGSNIGDFTGPIPETSTGWGYQIDAFLSYQVNEWASVGIGGRYWYMQARGTMHFENHVVGLTAFPQVLEWKTQNFGVFLQGSIQFGPYDLISVR